MIVRVLASVALGVAALIGVVFIGLRVPAPSFPFITPASAPLTTTPIPTELPPPVQRFLRAVYGDAVPQFQTAVIIGRGTLAPMAGIAMPARFQFSYDRARGHYHAIETTWFGLPLMRVDERYLDEHAILQIPVVGRVENDAHTDHASRQGFWAELMAWIPATMLDPRLQWQPLDDTSARVFLPGADAVEGFTLRFDSQTHFLLTVDTERYRDTGDSALLDWHNVALEWGDLAGIPTMLRSSTHWESDPAWATWEIEQVSLNVPVAARLDQFGG
jgi:hypothetical protein